MQRLDNNINSEGALRFSFSSSKYSNLVVFQNNSPLFSLGQILTARQTTTALLHYLPTCICVKDWLCSNVQSYPRHLVTQQSLFEHSWTGNVSRSMNQCEGANWLFESYWPCSYRRVPYTFYVKHDWGDLFSRESWFTIFFIRDSWLKMVRSFHVHVNEFFFI